VGAVRSSLPRFPVFRRPKPQSPCFALRVRWYAPGTTDEEAAMMENDPLLSDEVYGHDDEPDEDAIIERAQRRASGQHEVDVEGWDEEDEEDTGDED
jgi:hypothetical protein